MRLAVLDALNAVKEAGLKKLLPDRPRLTVGLGTCGVGNGANEVFHALADSLNNKGIDASLVGVGCLGFCAREPLVTCWLPGQPLVVLQNVRPEDVDDITDALAYGRPPLRNALCKIEEWDHITSTLTFGRGLDSLPHWYETPFFAGQKKIVLRNCGLINPEDIEEYIGIGGYFTLYHVLRNLSPEQVIEQVKQSRLRGRGGAGFPTGNKWEILRKAPGPVKYVICNADEGDPGAYMNRNEIESDPHSLLEGMMIGAYAMGATQGIIYVRAEYPLAVMRLKRALEQARDMNLLGPEILGTSFRFDIELVEGAGAFVCGEETALIASLEGRAGRPRPRPPYPAQSGLWGKPTNINNVETWYNIVPILAKGPDWFTQIGTKNNTGTKVFSLVGKVKNTGLVEMPLGSALKDIIYHIGGGTGSSKKVKAVQTGGPSGGCIPAQLFDTPVEYESLGALGAIMGSGGMVVMDEDNCMVDVARYFIEFSHAESCGQCTPCRVGLDHALRILRSITLGQASEEDLTLLEKLAQTIKETSLCGLGQTAPNPVLTTLRYFRDEYLEHIRQKRCRPTACEALFVSPCENSCPIHMNIPGFLALLDENRFDEAALAVFLDNPLPASTGRVCQHPCENRCRRGELDEPLAIRDVHRYIADQALTDSHYDSLLAALLARKAPQTPYRIAVVGAGPAGLTAAFYLSLLGHQVTVFEAHDQAGGMLRYALPEYRLPKSILAREISLIEKLGARFVFRTRLGTDLSLQDLEKDFHATVLAVGTWRESALGIPGADLKGVMSSLYLLEQVNRGRPPELGRHVVVIGGGNSAIDSARTAIRLGASVTVAYRRSRPDMPAIVEETEQAELEGVKFEFLAIPRRILAGEAGQVTGLEITEAELGPFDTFGRRIPVPTERSRVIPCDSIIVAVGEKADGDLVRTLGLRLLQNDLVEVNPLTFQTSRPNVYAAGDLVTGPANVTTAMGSGKAVARAIDRTLTGLDRWDQLRADIRYHRNVPLEPRGGRRHSAVLLPLSERTGNFREIIPALPPDAARTEASRCLRCDVKISPESTPTLALSVGAAST